MRSLRAAPLGVGLQVTGLAAAAYYWSQLAEIGGCGRGGKFGNIVYGPPCPAGTHDALLVMLIGLGLGMLGAF
ncbi:MAG: hypothetical protein M3O90_11190, partial [Actinomycetota bacterium]|nr:hypothetical protein [Actinomycetota bacterium]